MQKSGYHGSSTVTLKNRNTCAIAPSELHHSCGHICLCFRQFYIAIISHAETIIGIDFLLVAILNHNFATPRDNPRITKALYPTKTPDQRQNEQRHSRRESVRQLPTSPPQLWMRNPFRFIMFSRHQIKSLLFQMNLTITRRPIHQNSKSSLSELSINIVLPSPRSIGVEHLTEPIGHWLVFTDKEAFTPTGGAFVATNNRICSAS